MQSLDRPLVEVAAPVARNGKWYGAALLHLPAGDVKIIGEADEPAIREAYRLASVAAAGIASVLCRLAPGQACTHCGQCSGIAPSSSARSSAAPASSGADALRELAPFVPLLGPGAALADASSRYAVTMAAHAQRTTGALYDAMMAKNVSGLNPIVSAGLQSAQRTHAATRNELATATDRALSDRERAADEVKAAQVLRLAGAGSGEAMAAIERIAELAEAGDPDGRAAWQPIETMVNLARSHHRHAGMIGPVARHHELVARLHVVKAIGDGALAPWQQPPGNGSPAPGQVKNGSPAAPQRGTPGQGALHPWG
jgi:hypothetical protein